MNQSSSLAAKAGIVIIVGIVLLIGFSFRSSGRGWFYRGYEVTAHFETAKGIEPGSPVVMLGVPIGRVESLRIMPEGDCVEAALLIDKPHRVAADAVASIRLKTLLGSYHVYLAGGTPEAGFIEPGDSLATEEIKDIAETLSDLGRLAKGPGGAFESLQEDSKTLLATLTEVVEENRENLQTTTEAFAEAGPKLNELIDNALEVSRSLNEGTGTLGRLTQSDELYQDLTAITDDLGRFAEGLNSGDGTAAMLLHDAEQRRKVEAIIDNVQTVSGQVRTLMGTHEEGLNQSVASFIEFMPKLNEGMDHFVSIGRKVDEGDGTLGKLVNDPEIYDAVRDAVNQIRRTFEQGEEQSVMRTFMSVVVGSLI